MLDDAGLSRLVVIGRDQQRAISAGVLRVLRQLDGLPGVVGAGSGYDRNAAVGRGDDDLDYAPMLRVGHRRRLATRPARAQAVDAGLDLPLDVLGERALIHHPVAKRGDEGGEDSLQHGLAPPLRVEGSGFRNNTLF